jgi:septum formation protein
VAFEVRPAGVAELAEGDPAEVALHNAREKAAAIAPEPGQRVLGCDTLVALDGRIYGKPESEIEAATALRALSGRTHEVWSGLVVSGAGERVVCTQVTFRSVDDDLLGWYLAAGEWRGRAGGYAIQGRGAALVERVEGDFFNVVGLPVAALLELVPEILRSP